MLQLLFSSRRSGNLYTVSIRQSIDDNEEEIVKRYIHHLITSDFWSDLKIPRSVESLDNLYMLDRNLQTKLGIKVDQSGRSL